MNTTPSASVSSSRSSRVWQTLLAVPQVIAVLVAIPAVPLGAYLCWDDAQTHSDEWDGFGLFLGLALGGSTGLLALLAVVTLWLLARGRSRGAAAVVACEGSAIVALVLWAAAGVGRDVLLVGVVAATLLLGPAAALLAEPRRPLAS
ncbi:hypothetical protein [Nocardioides acrostichi]|uniref:Uncharacterized protein n=1 Tax=Nocardioides acrostichi TaxID=2784339 RepID=A0A930UXG1_9ACTN|nr:hypothetical protein [Nocardioides acrostichi]MBF4160169.1 hypothetical protein [Nocardioides acrostichi]